MYRYLMRSQYKRFNILRWRSTNKFPIYDKTLPIIEELCKLTDIDTKVNIITEVPIIVNSCDVVEHKEGNVFHAKLRSSIPTLNETTEKPKRSWFNWFKKDTPKEQPEIAMEKTSIEKGCMQIIISRDQKHIDVILHKKNCASNAYCEIVVPFFADLVIESFAEVTINSLNSQDLVVTSAGNIYTSNVRCQRDINLCSFNGSIFCKNRLLGKTIQLSTTKKHPIGLELVSGGKLHAITEEGNITTQSVYSMNSRFESKTGHLQLKNVHKQSDIVMHGKGAIKLEGTRAELNIFAEDSTLDLKLAYVYGHNIINCKEAAVNIGISDKMQKYLDLDICTTSLKLDNSLKSLEEFVSEDKTKLERKIGQDNKDKLTIRGQCTITLFQQLWINNLVNHAKKSVTKQ